MTPQTEESKHITPEMCAVLRYTADATAAHAGQTTRNFYDSHGAFAGTARTHGKATTIGVYCGKDRNVMNGAHTGKFVAYYRVSTQRQGRSGLGLEAQQTAVRDFLNGDDWRLVAEVTEVESGKRSDRPKLAEALKLCRLHGAALIIAKLDRLARNVAFISNLMESGWSFTPSISRRPTASRFTSWLPSPSTKPG
jgi:hypothetical protein